MSYADNAVRQAIQETIQANAEETHEVAVTAEWWTTIDGEECPWLWLVCTCGWRAGYDQRYPLAELADAGTVHVTTATRDGAA